MLNVHTWLKEEGWKHTHEPNCYTFVLKSAKALLVLKYLQLMKDGNGMLIPNMSH